MNSKMVMIDAPMYNPMVPPMSAKIWDNDKMDFSAAVVSIRFS